MELNAENPFGAMMEHNTSFICQVRDSLWLTINNRAEAGAGIRKGWKGLKVSLGDSNETILSRMLCDMRD